MRGLNCHVFILIFGGTCAALSACTIPLSARGDREFQLSFAAGSRDSAGNFLGGTEVRLLTGHRGKLYAGNGYWEDRPGLEGPQGADPRSDEPRALAVDHSSMSECRGVRATAISALSEIALQPTAAARLRRRCRSWPPLHLT